MTCVKFGNRIIPKEEMLSHILFDKDFSRYGKYYKGRKIKLVPVKTIKILEMRIT